MAEVAPNLRQERANELLDVTGFLAGELESQTGSTVFGMNRGVVDEFLDDRERILTDVANGQWADVADEIGSADFQRQAARLDVVTSALRCDEEDDAKGDPEEEENAQPKEARKLGQLKALTGVAGNFTTQTQGSQAAFFAIMAILLIGAILYVGTILIARKLKNSRRYRRYYCQIEGKLIGAGDDIDIKVVEISRSGAKIAGDVLPDPKTDVTLHVLDQAIPAKIVWSNADYAGVAFDKLIKVRVDDLAVEPNAEDGPPDNDAIPDGAVQSAN